MKKSSLSRVTKLFLLNYACAAFFCAGIFAADPSSQDPNQLFSFKKIFVAPVEDNVDGAFQTPIAQSYKEVFDKNPRFEVVSSKDASDTTVLTKLEKKASGLDLEINLVLTGSSEIFAIEKLTIPAEATGVETGVKVKQLLKSALRRIPFYGTVTGREKTEVTFDIGTAHGLKEGDIIQISRIDHVKRHPLLKTIVDVQLVPVGNATIEQAEETISFGKVYSEITGESIQRMHKVTAIEARQAPVKKEGEGEYKEDIIDEDRPQLGFVGLGVFIGGFSSTTSQGLGGTSYSGGAFTPGIKLQTEIWLTKNWFADLAFGATTMSYRQNNATTSESSLPTDLPGYSGNTRQFGINAGYKYLPTGSIYGPQVSLKVGYYNFTWEIPVVATDLMSPKSYSGLNLGVAGQLPVTSRGNAGALLNLNVLLFPSTAEDKLSVGTKSSASGVNFFVGGYYHLSTHLALRAGVQFDSYSADFDGGASTNQKAIGFLPSILYYF